MFRHFFDRSIHRKVKVEKVKPGKRTATEIRPRKNTRVVHERAGIEGWKKANNTLKPKGQVGVLCPLALHHEIDLDSAERGRMHSREFSWPKKNLRT